MNIILADKTARLYNYVVDMVAISIIMFFGFFFTVMGFNPSGNAPFYIICFLSYYGYYFLMEWQTGKTLGKHLTNTIIRTPEGEQATLMQFLIRTFLRIPGLDAIYMLFGSGIAIHDKFSGTRVITSK